MGGRHGALPRQRGESAALSRGARAVSESRMRFRVSDLLGTLREPYTVYMHAIGVHWRGAWLFTPVKPCPRDDTTLLWSAQLSCVQMSGFRVRDGLAHCEKTNPGPVLRPLAFLLLRFLRRIPGGTLITPRNGRFPPPSSGNLIRYSVAHTCARG